MEVIIEYVLVDNLVINFLILFLTSKILKVDLNKIRTIFANIFGTGMAFLFPILNLPASVFVLLKLLIGGIISLIAFDCKTIKRFFINYFVFISSTALFGGISFIICFLSTGKLNPDIFQSLNLNFPVGAILGIAFVYFYVVLGAIKTINERKKISEFVFSAQVKKGDKKVYFKGYLDTGNTLIDPKTNQPVVIVQYALFNKIFKVPIEKILTQKSIDEVEGARYIEYKTVGKEIKKMLVFPVEKLIVKTGEKTVERKDAILGLSFQKFTKFFGCEALLNPGIL